jgi:hypothetical protein
MERPLYSKNCVCNRLREEPNEGAALDEEGKSRFSAAKICWTDDCIPVEVFLATIVPKNESMGVVKGYNGTLKARGLASAAAETYFNMAR